MGKNIKDLMKWRFACKHFKQDQKIPSEVLKDLLETTHLAPSSFGLQGWKFVVIVNDEIKQKLAAVCYHQPQITEADALVFFCARTDLAGENGVIDRHVKKSQKDLGKTDEEADNFRKVIEGVAEMRGPEGVKAWLQRQVYLPAMTLMLAAAEQGIDSAPMEGFDAAGVAKVLELPEYLHPTIVVGLGYRNMEAPAKTRLNLEEIVEIR